MRIELLYMPGCPNHEPALDRLRRVLGRQAVTDPIHEIAVTDENIAANLRFPGSPTIRVNGRDVEPEGISSFGLACRLYGNGTGIPSEETIGRAVSSAAGEDGRESD